MKSFIMFLSILTFMFCGCASHYGEKGLTARYTHDPLVLDGRLDDPAWRQAAVYRMQLSRDRQAAGRSLREGADVRVTWDDEFLYLGICLVDSDITATGERDQLHHYKFGDLCELFIKPENQSNYLELYVTPHGKKTSFYIPEVNEQRNGPVRLDDFVCGLCVAAHIDEGTLNQRNDRDGNWSAEMAIPVVDLERLGGKIVAGAPWRIFVSRYNHSRFLGTGDNKIEYSMVPPLSQTSYHLVDEYARLHLER